MQGIQYVNKYIRIVCKFTVFFSFGSVKNEYEYVCSDGVLGLCR